MALRTDGDLSAHPGLMEDLLAVLADGEMPPKKAQPLPDKDRAQLMKFLKSQLDASLDKADFEPTPMGRMTRFQYNNAVKGPPTTLMKLTRAWKILYQKIIGNLY